MANIPNDFNKRRIKKIFPEVMSELEERIKSLYETNIACLIDLDDEVPSIRVSMSYQGVLQEREYQKKIDPLAVIITEIAEKHGLVPRRGGFDPTTNRKVWEAYEDVYTLMPK